MAKKKKVTIVTKTVTKTETIVLNNEKTHIICVLDRSGSMSSIMTDSIGGFNTFLQQQKELPDDATITVALFDDKYELLYDYVDIKKAKELTKKEWYPRGTTALYDAICKTIHHDKAKLAKLGSEAPAKVLVCVVTDGYENASKENSLADTEKLIKECEKDDWNFIYLAANQDAFAVGRGFGISYGNTYTYTATADGVSDMSNKMSYATSNYRGMCASSADFGSMSKSLIDDDKDDKDVDNVSSTGNVVVDGSSITIDGGDVNTVTTTGDVDVNTVTTPETKDD